MDVLLSKVKEVLSSVLPIVLIVIVLHFTLIPLDNTVFIKFLVGSILIVIGLSIFLIGVDIGLTPIGNNMGSSITKTNKLWFVVAAGLVLGFFISIAEPDLHILADQVQIATMGATTKWAIVIVVSIGVAAMISIGFVRIVHKIKLNRVLIFAYGFILLLGMFASPEFLAIAFDASGATTGALTVPFILALAAGVASLNRDSKSSEEDSFGLVALASSGAIMGVLVMDILLKNSNSLEVASPIISTVGAETLNSNFLKPFFEIIPKITYEVFLSLFPIVVVFLIYQKKTSILSKNRVRSIMFGILFTFLGLIIFLVGVNAGFMDVGRIIGNDIAKMNNFYIIALGFILGFVTILAEPAVHVLTRQIEDVTSGYVNKKIVLITLSIGVGVAVALSVVRLLIPELQLWHYLLPGYIISIVMTFFVPNLFVGIAFDSGGVASGPMTATFILAFIQGIAEAMGSTGGLMDGFGMIAMVAMTPLIAIQILGVVFKIKSKKQGVE
ncbi:Protein of unknown function [Anaerosphaera aminiphila DSM 21120]|uniref:DUF1538 domain-containing protein n=1 Tax=Anaerosphaera aminiphila DSM 21120 TaxID=1120995 RepID=A0A1M5P454_9FIRM|nr:DUF1538 domain-containing protein [Anaerosphaera aminiphila]SHG95973.1 Protein of unknown function [Anaerosphaera aminiphila DSM 21120]